MQQAVDAASGLAPPANMHAKLALKTPTPRNMFDVMSSRIAGIHGGSRRYKTNLALRWARQEAKANRF
jgi:hypothetical protein